MVISASLACALHSEVPGRHGCGLQRPWPGRDLPLHKEPELALPLSQPPGHRKVAQFTKASTMAVCNGEPSLGSGPSALWFKKAWVWG